MTRPWMADTLRAAALALALGCAWTMRDWTALTALRLPDTDDTMRLVQVRDWLGGQGWSDLTQHRMAGGVPMHWTRLVDLGPAGLILALGPLLGRHAAEVAAVIAWPLMLFAATLLLVQRIARVGADQQPAAIAAVVAAIAYPATTVFAPGRIDHHGMQVLLLLASTLALLGPATFGRGAWQGALAAASLVIGLETAPLIGLLGLIALGEWIGDRERARWRLGGIATGAGGGLLVARVVFAPDRWMVGWCDGLTGDSWSAAAAMAISLAVLALVPTRARATTRLGLAAVALACAGAYGVLATPRCLSPYGGIDPFLARGWLARVGEAQSILSAPLATSIAYLGVTAAGLLAGWWRICRVGGRTAAILFVMQFAALALACTQLRGAYAAALLGAPALATLIVAARQAGLLRLVGAWTVSAGILYPIAAQAAEPGSAVTGEAQSGATCELPPILSRLTPGMVLAPIDLGPRILLDTSHAVLAAPYHRNNSGNLTMYRFFEAEPRRARAIAAANGVDYVLVCPGRLWGNGVGGRADLYRLRHAAPPASATLR